MLWEISASLRSHRALWRHRSGLLATRLLMFFLIRENMIKKLIYGDWELLPSNCSILSNMASWRILLMIGRNIRTKWVESIMRNICVLLAIYFLSIALSPSNWVIWLQRCLKTTQNKGLVGFRSTNQTFCTSWVVIRDW